MKTNARKNILFCAMTALFMAFSSASAFADNCYMECMDAAGCWSSRSDENVSFCSGMTATCSTRCRDGNGGGKSYGAIAYSAKDGAYGFSDSWKDRKSAEKTAVKFCSKYGKKCEVLVWFYNSCGAVAAGGKKTGWGRADSLADAQKQALAKCKKSGGKNCEIKASHCSK